jgi:hypothetical protein
MKTIAQKTWAPSYHSPSLLLLWSKFINWCKNEERNRLGWLALGLAGHGCVITPLVVLAITMSGNNFIFWIIAMVAMGATLVINLAALPTKITIPIFLFSVMIDIMIVVITLGNGFNI